MTDRLTEALEATRPCDCGSMSRDAASDFRAVAAEAVEMRQRAERAEADLAEAVSKLGAANVGLGQWKAKAQGLAIDLADEKRRHAETEALLRRVLDEKRIRHDHAYPMEVGPHHCAGCDVEAELSALLSDTTAGDECPEHPGFVCTHVRSGGEDHG